MIKIETLPRSAAWIPDSDTVQSFQGNYQVGRLHGRARLVRLLSHAGRAPEGQLFKANHEDGSYWFDEADWRNIRSAATADLRSQGNTSANALAAYLRLQLRDLLAIRRDWTPNFDYVVPIEIPAGGSLVALVGKIKKQGVYSRHIPGSSATGRQGIFLRGGLTQFVINFDHGDNPRARTWIKPFERF